MAHAIVSAEARCAQIFQKLQTIPMHNYANFLNLMTTGFYIPASFAYILPMIKWGSLITPEQRAVPTRDFAVMGFLDCLAGIDTHCQ